MAKRLRTEFGIPDVRIDDGLVLELKVGPHEGEKDRLIGQCCKYSVEWVTWRARDPFRVHRNDRSAKPLVK